MNLLCSLWKIRKVNLDSIGIMKIHSIGTVKDDQGDVAPSRISAAKQPSRLDIKYPLCNMFKLFTCVVCQVEMKPEEGVSIHAGSSSNRRNLKPWGGPFLCIRCQEKKEAMEEKNHSRR
nr:probable protein phosphatase 2C 12 [Tanacetum cinerariifolium]